MKLKTLIKHLYLELELYTHRLKIPKETFTQVTPWALKFVFKILHSNFLLSKRLPQSDQSLHSEKVRVPWPTSHSDVNGQWLTV